MEHIIKKITKSNSLNTVLLFCGMLFIMFFVGCNSSKPTNSFNSIQLYEDSLYSECLKDTSEYAEQGFFDAFHENELVELVKSDTSSMSYPFEKLQEVGCVYTNTSKDGNFRIYEWNDYGVTTRWGGINYLCQYRTKNGEVKTIDDLFDLIEPTEECGGVFLEGLNRISEVCSVESNDGNTIYVLDFYGRADTQYGNHLIAAFCIGEDSLKEYKAFEDGKSYLYVEYGGISDWNARTGGLGWEWVNNYDEENKAIYVPHFTHTDIMLDRYDVYQFDGNIFRNVRTDGGFWLNSKLRDFAELKTVFKTTDYLIRVDAVGDGFYRYTSWKKGKTMLDEPDLEIMSDLYEKESNSYIFIVKDAVDGEYDYIVDDGQGLYSHEKGFVIKHNGKVILRQNREF